MLEDKTLEEFVNKRLIDEGLASGCDHWYAPRPEYVEERRKVAGEEYHKLQKNCL